MSVMTFDWSCLSTAHACQGGIAFARLWSMYFCDVEFSACLERHLICLFRTTFC